MEQHNVRIACLLFHLLGFSVFYTTTIMTEGEEEREIHFSFKVVIHCPYVCVCVCVYFYILLPFS